VMPRAKCRTTAVCILLILATAGTSFSRDSTGEEPSSDTTQADSQGAPRGKRTFMDDITSNKRNKIGFSVGVFGVYQSNVNRTSTPEAASSATTTLRLFANLGRRKSSLHLDYAAGYLFYSHNKGLNSLEQRGNGAYSRQLTRKMTFLVQDTFASSPNGYYGSFFSPTIPTTSIPSGISTEFQVRRQGIIRNDVVGRLEYVTSKDNFSVYGAHSLYRFEVDKSQNINLPQVGASYSRQIKRWLSLGTNYSTYVSNVIPENRNAWVQSVQAGDLGFNMGKIWQANFSGGVDYAITHGYNVLTGSAYATLTMSTDATWLLFEYHRGLESTTSISGLFLTDNGRVSLGNRLTNRLNLQLRALYSRSDRHYSAGQMTGGGYAIYSGGAGLEYSFFKGLIASANFIYRNQRSHDISGLPTSLNGYVASGGVQFVFPSRAR
jgi:hypothetical protein